MQLTFSQIKTIKSFCEELFSTPDWREVVGQIADDETDFEVDNVRFIHTDSIDSIMADELEGDEYVLGSFNTNTIADVTGWPSMLIEAAQKGGAYKEIGEALIDGDFVPALAKAYSDADGYGHHFNSYDGNEEELNIGSSMFHVFDQH